MGASRAGAPAQLKWTMKPVTLSTAKDRLWKN
jgi:hypothetical protein